MNEPLQVWAAQFVDRPGSYLTLRHPVTRSIQAQWHVDTEDLSAIPQVAKTFVQMYDMKLIGSVFGNPHVNGAYRTTPRRVL